MKNKYVLLEIYDSIDRQKLLATSTTFNEHLDKLIEQIVEYRLCVLLYSETKDKNRKQFLVYSK